MKVIIGGSTSMVGTEIIRQALSHPDVTSVVGIGRRVIQPPPDLGPKADPSKFKSVALKDFENYPEDVKRELYDADAVIWTIGVNPAKLRSMTWEEACKVSRDFAVAAIKTIGPLPREGKTAPLRFICMSGEHAERDQTKRPFLMADYCLMRGDAENQILAYAANSNGTVEALISKAGVIQDPESSLFRKTGHLLIQAISRLGKIHVPVIAACLLDQALHGFEKDTLRNDDLNRIGHKALAKYGRGVAEKK
uniref:NAD(P)-binding domain-containing protein n=1 Tax=Ovatospora brasiliensis TaxID=1934393 RepID=A0A8K1DZY9_9PEZI|nr:hypothetical protein [Ovatospora brasiliensis]